MQIILLLPLLRLPFPAPIRVLFSVLDKIFNFEFFDMNSLIVDRVIGQQSEDDATMKETFEMEGYETANAIRNLGSSAVYIVAFITMDGIMIVVGLITKKAGIE